MCLGQHNHEHERPAPWSHFVFGASICVASARPRIDKSDYWHLYTAKSHRTGGVKIHRLHRTVSVQYAHECSGSHGTRYFDGGNHSLTAILVSRFLLDLQAIKRRREDGSMPELKSDLYSYRAQRTLVFEHVVDSLGSFIRTSHSTLQEGEVAEAASIS